MSTENRYTLADYAQELRASEADMKLIQTIEDTEPLFKSAPLIKCNAGNEHLTQVVSKYPKGQTRGFNEGVTAEKAGTRVVKDTTCMTETYNEIDVKIVQMNKNSAKWRSTQDQIFVRGLTHSVAERIFQGSKKRDINEFDGLCARYSKINGTNVINAGGTATDGELQDIFLINWGENTCHLIYPEGGIAGLSSRFEQNVDVRDAKNRVFKADRTWYSWDLGLAIPDPAQVVRICNVPLTKALNGRAGYDIINALIMATEGLPNDVLPGCGIYMSQKMRAALRLQINGTENVNLTWEEVAGKRVLNWDGIAVHKVDNIVLPSYKTAIA